MQEPQTPISTTFVGKITGYMTEECIHVNSHNTLYIFIHGSLVINEVITKMKENYHTKKKMQNLQKFDLAQFLYRHRKQSVLLCLTGKKTEFKPLSRTGRNVATMNSSRFWFN